MFIDTLTSLIQTGQWAALAFLILTLANTLLSSESKFAITLPSFVRPLATILIGQVLGVIAAKIAGVPLLHPAVHAALASVLAIATSHAIWNGDAPKWMQSIAMLASAFEGGSDAKSVADKASKGLTVLLVMSMPFFAMQTACPKATPIVAPAMTLAQCIVDGALAGKSLTQIVESCGSDVPAVVVAIINAMDPAILATPAHAEALAVQHQLAVAHDAGN